MAAVDIAGFFPGSIGADWGIISPFLAPISGVSR
jgi:hypothetical protein